VTGRGALPAVLTTLAADGSEWQHQYSSTGVTEPRIPHCACAAHAQVSRGAHQHRPHRFRSVESWRSSRTDTHRRNAAPFDRAATHAPCSTRKPECDCQSTHPVDRGSLYTQQCSTLFTTSLARAHRPPAGGPRPFWTSAQPAAGLSTPFAFAQGSARLDSPYLPHTFAPNTPRPRSDLAQPTSGGARWGYRPILRPLRCRCCRLATPSP
jgi:hypothetical protein